MDAALQRIEALPGRGRYALTFVRPDGGAQITTVQIAYDGVHVAESALPPGWGTATDAFRAAADAVLAIDAARRHAPSAAGLSDVPGGWDVSLGNVVLGATGTPMCVAHGDLVGAAELYTCPECGAKGIMR